MKLSVFASAVALILASPSLATASPPEDGDEAPAPKRSRLGRGVNKVKGTDNVKVGKGRNRELVEGRVTHGKKRVRGGKAQRAKGQQQIKRGEGKVRKGGESGDAALTQRGRNQVKRGRLNRDRGANQVMKGNEEIRNAKRDRKFKGSGTTSRQRFEETRADGKRTKRRESDEKAQHKQAVEETRE